MECQSYTGNRAHFQLLTVVLGSFQNLWKIAHPEWDSNPLTLDYMLSALPAKLRESVFFQFLIWDTGSGDIDIFVYKC